MSTSPYRQLPIVQERPLAVCLDCTHTTFVGCTSASAALESWWSPLNMPDHGGDCGHYRPRPWLRILEWLGVRKAPTRKVVVEP